MGIAPSSVSDKRDLEFSVVPFKFLATKKVPEAELTRDFLWSWLVVVVLETTFLALFATLILPALEKVWPDNACAVGWMSTFLNVAFLCLMIFLVQPAIDSAIRKEPFGVYWILDIKKGGNPSQ